MTTQETLENVEKALSEIRPFLESDGGNIKLLSIENERCKSSIGRSLYWLLCKSNDTQEWC